MKKSDVIKAWGRILTGRQPSLSIEITRECPLRCPGCYAYEPEHLQETGQNLRSVSDYKGDDLIDKVLELVREHRPLHLSIVGGEPLVRFRELNILLPQLSAMGISVQLVTSAVREIPKAWNKIKISPSSFRLTACRPNTTRGANRRLTNESCEISPNIALPFTAPLPDRRRIVPDTTKNF